MITRSPISVSSNRADRLLLFAGSQIFEQSLKRELRCPFPFIGAKNGGKNPAPWHTMAIIAKKSLLLYEKRDPSFLMLELIS
jgi:hypothetical protein